MVRSPREKKRETFDGFLLKRAGLSRVFGVFSVPNDLEYVTKDFAAMHGHGSQCDHPLYLPVTQ